MRVKQLLEAKKADFSSLQKVWQGPVLHGIISTLGEMGDAEKLLGRIIESARTKKAETEPESLLSFINPLMKVASSKEAKEALGDHFIFMQQVGRLLDLIVNHLLAMTPPPMKFLASKADVEKMQGFMDKSTGMKLKLAVSKHTRSNADKKFDKENDRFIFIGRPAFREEPEGSGNFKKTLEIENLVKIDRFDPESHRAAEIMQLRAKQQGGDSSLYMVVLPAGVITTKTTTSIDPWLVDLINQHKTRVG